MPNFHSCQMSVGPIEGANISLKSVVFQNPNTHTTVFYVVQFKIFTCSNKTNILLSKVWP